MKSIVLLLTLVCSQHIFSQQLYSEINQKSDYNITITFKDGEQKQYSNVKLSKIYTGMKQSYSVMPSQKPLNVNKLKKQKITIKQKKAKKIEILQNKVRELFIEDTKRNTTYRFKNLTIKKFDKDLNLVTEAENILLPLRRSDSINIYGYKIITIDVSNEQRNGINYSRTMPPIVTGTYYYLNHADSNVAINPIDFSGGLFNGKLISDKFVATLKEVGKDCDAFVAQYENYNYEKVSRKQSKEFIKTYRKKTKAIKKESKKLPKKERAAFLEAEYERVFMLDNFIKIIDDYKAKCTN